MQKPNLEGLQSIGSFAKSIGAYGIALGFSSSAGTKAVSLGSGSSAQNFGVSIGHGSASLSNASLAIGVDSQAGILCPTNRCIAIGRDSTVEGNDSICLGSNSKILEGLTGTTVIGCNFKSADRSNALYVTPIRNATPNVPHILYYDEETKEITYEYQQDSTNNTQINLNKARCAFNAVDIALNLARVKLLEDRCKGLEAMMTTVGVYLGIPYSHI